MGSVDCTRFQEIKFNVFVKFVYPFVTSLLPQDAKRKDKIHYRGVVSQDRL